MTENLEADQADSALKARHRAMWALGAYDTVVEEVIPELGEILVAAAGIRPGDRVLDVAAGSGNAAIPAARAGARVVASDLTPELLDAGRAKADRAGLAIEWTEDDAEALRFADATFDAVISCVGVMFAPHHARAADELVRVTRPGGTIAILSWTPGGFIGQMFATMRPFAPPPPPGTLPPPLWGDPTHVAALLGRDVVDLRTEVRRLRVDRFGSPTDFRDFFKRTYGPTIAVYRSLNGDPERVAALDAALDDLGARFGAESGSMEWEYLIATARRA